MNLLFLTLQLNNYTYEKSHATRYTLHATRYTLQEKLKFSLFLIMFLSTNFLFSQSPSGVTLNWNSYVSCQTYGEIRGNGGKEPILIEDIPVGQCINVCNNTAVTYTLGGSLAANPITVWTITGGTVSSSSNTTCTVLWQNLGAGELKFVTTGTSGTFTKIICIEKIEIPTSSFSMAPFTTQNFDLYACAQQTVYFNNLSTTNGGSGFIQYHWDFGDYSTATPFSTSSAFAPTHAYQNTGTYTVSLTVFNSCGCSSVFKQKIFIGAKGFDIICPSVVCEGQTATYTLPDQALQVCRDRRGWSVIGGIITGQINNNISVLWNKVDDTGFGSVTFDPLDCTLACPGIPTTIKVPVIQNIGVIKGNQNTCVGNQERFVLPQWPATAFTWSVVDNSGQNRAFVIHTDQRNEVIVQPRVNGNMTVRCTYNNTLLHCGGTAEFILSVNSDLLINGPAAVCQNSIANYSNASGINVSWTLKDSASNLIASNASSSIFNYNFTNAGEYNLVIQGASNCPSSSKKITVLQEPPIPPAVTGATIICPNAPYTYTIAGSNPNGLYTWQIVGGTINGATTGNSVNVVFNTNATHTLTVINQTQFPGQCNSAPRTVNITNQTVDARISDAFATLCANSIGNYSAIKLGVTPDAPYNAGDTYTWSIWNATNTAAAPLAGSVTAGQGTNAISLLWNNIVGNNVLTVTLRLVIQKCSLPAQIFTKVITINPLPDLIVTAVPSNPCSGQTISLTLSNTNGVLLSPTTNVDWDLGDGFTDTAVGLTYSYQYFNTNQVPALGTTFNVKAKIVNPNGCLGIVNASIKTITVRPAPSAACSISQNGNVFCPPALITTILSATTTTGATIKWYKQGSPNLLGTGATLQINNTAAFGYGAYYFSATNAGGCTTASNYVPVLQSCGQPSNCVLNPAPVVSNNAEMVCSPPNPATICTNCGKINLAATSNGVPNDGFWEIFGPDAQNSSTFYTNPVFPAGTVTAIPGEYNIFYNAKFICTDQTTVYVRRYKKITVPFIANFQYTVQCSGNNYYNVTLTDTSPFFALVDTRTFQYFTSPSASGPWTAVANNNNRNFVLTNQQSGNFFIRLLVGGKLDGVSQSRCQKIVAVSLAANNVQTIFAPAVKCHDTAVKFSLNGFANSNDTYLWTFDGGATNTLAEPLRVFNNSGPQTVTCQIKNQYGCLKPLLSFNLTVPPQCFKGTISSSANASATACANNPIVLSYAPAADACAPSKYFWMNGNQPVPNTGTTQTTIAVTESGFYWVKVVSATPNNCEYSTPNRITPIFNVLPTVDFAPIQIYCANTDVPAHISSSATTITWSVDGVPYPAFNDLKDVVFLASNNFSVGSHTITVTATSAAGCIKTALQTFTIAASPPAPTVSVTLMTCNPYAVKLTALGSYGTINWSNGATGATIEVTNGGPVEVTASAGGCISRGQIDVPKNPENFLWVFPTGCFTNCMRNTSTLLGPSVLPVKFYNWSIDQQVVASGANINTPPLPLAGNGAYNLEINTGLCAKRSDNLNYNVIDCPKCPLNFNFDYSNNEELPFCGIVVTINVSNSSSDPVPFTLTVPDNDVIISANSFTAVPGNNNVFVVTIVPINGFQGGNVLLSIKGLIAGNKQLCNDFVNLTMPRCIAAARGTANGDTALTSRLIIAPNPSKGNTTINYLTSSKPTIAIYSVLGVLQKTYNAENNEGSWNIATNDLPAGLYIVVLKDQEKIVAQQKLIIE